ncbi:hypothetical protein QL285_022075 [Trifolium repens]|nr:hypothetical protein QL285_022075 [Trifolium repens]
MRHLSECISKEFKNSSLIHLLRKAAYATTTTAFKEKMAEIEEASPEAAKWHLKSSSWYSVLTPSAERRMVEAINHTSTYQVLKSDEVEFEDVYAYTSKCFTIASYRDTYAEELHPVPRKLEWRRIDESALDNDITVVRPPKFRRPPGRPENKQIYVEDHNRDKHTVHCSRCNQTVHFKTTCKVEMINSIEQF